MASLCQQTLVYMTFRTFVKTTIIFTNRFAWIKMSTKKKSIFILRATFYGGLLRFFRFIRIAPWMTTRFSCVVIVGRIENWKHPTRFWKCLFAFQRISIGVLTEYVSNMPLYWYGYNIRDNRKISPREFGYANGIKRLDGKCRVLYQCGVKADVYSMYLCTTKHILYPIFFMDEKRSRNNIDLRNDFKWIRLLFYRTLL